MALVENNTDEYVVFENEGKEKLIISAKDAARATEDIIKRNHIPSWHSEDVSLWLKK